MAKNVHKSAKGRIVDLDALRSQHGSERALGNANMNVRGDYLDAQGNVVKRREEIVQEYYKNNPNGVRKASLKPSEDYETPEQAVARLRENNVDKPSNIIGKGRGRKMVTPKE